VGQWSAVARRPGPIGRRVGALLCCGALGLAAAQAVHAVNPRLAVLEAFDRANGLAWTTALLLAVGLYSSACGISVADLRRNRGTVLAAVTIGVVAKALLVGATMYLFYGQSACWVLGIAVAQIDPIAVAATLRYRTMSPTAKAIMTAWACFDDPATILLTAYLALPLLTGSSNGVSGVSDVSSGGTGSLLRGIALNTLLIACALGCALLLRQSSASGEQHGRSAHPPQALAGVAVLVLLAIAGAYGLLLGITVVGLFFRPLSAHVLNRAVSFAVLAAAFLLGVFLRTGADFAEGFLLGLAAYAAQIVVGCAITRRLSRTDRMRVALGQQNGLTAMALALTLQPRLPDAVHIIAVAVATTSVLYLLGNALWDRVERQVGVGLRVFTAWQGAEAPAADEALRDCAVDRLEARATW
jgi:NhaP-type Na+/H+ or K+/H+ antiporter